MDNIICELLLLKSPVTCYFLNRCYDPCVRISLSLSLSLSLCVCVCARLCASMSVRVWVCLGPISFRVWNEWTLPILNFEIEINLFSRVWCISFGGCIFKRTAKYCHDDLFGDVTFYELINRLLGSHNTVLGYLAYSVVIIGISVRFILKCNRWLFYGIRFDKTETNGIAVLT